MEKLWYSDTKCDFCKKECIMTLYDAQTNMGCWATMCEHCFKKYGIGVGAGIGQKYIKNKHGKFQKTNG